MPGPEYVDVELEAELSDLEEAADTVVADLAARSRFVHLEGRKFPNTDGLSTQPLRCLRRRSEPTAPAPLGAPDAPDAPDERDAEYERDERDAEYERAPDARRNPGAG